MSKLWGKRAYPAYASISLFITEEFRTGPQAGQDPADRSYTETMGVQFTGLLPDLLSLLSYRSQDQQPRDGITYNGLGSPPSVTKEMPYRCSYSPSTLTEQRNRKQDWTIKHQGLPLVT